MTEHINNLPWQKLTAMMMPWGSLETTLNGDDCWSNISLEPSATYLLITEANAYANHLIVINIFNGKIYDYISNVVLYGMYTCMNYWRAYIKTRTKWKIDQWIRLISSSMNKKWTRNDSILLIWGKPQELSVCWIYCFLTRIDADLT